MAITKDQVLVALKRVQDPELYKDIVTLNVVKSVKVLDANVSVELEVRNPAARDRLKAEVTAALQQIPGIEEIIIDVRTPLPTAPAAPQQQRPAEKKAVLPGVKHVIAVGAGKGGVGKSTIAVNLAVGLSIQGYKVGILDGDMYGPSVPTLTGLVPENPKVVEGMIQPFEIGPAANRIKIMSIGFMVDKEKALIWRGPMAQGALKQFMTDWDWGTLDYLIVDLPPGTGDISLTLAQSVPLTGAVIIATPQEVALMDARRAVRMFQQLGVEILGVVENMSAFVCEHGTTYDIFGRGGAQMMAQEMGLPFLGDLPLSTPLRKNSDAGAPFANFEPGSPSLNPLTAIVNTFLGQMQLRHTKPGPRVPTLQIS